MQNDVELHTTEIHEYIMFQLHQEFFSNDLKYPPSDEEIRF